jgi:hypothetical protein
VYVEDIDSDEDSEDVDMWSDFVVVDVN